jgi:hypothetical protein
MAPVLSRRERDRSLSHRRLVRAAAGDDYTVRLFNPYVFNREKLFPKELDELSNVIKDHRARLGSMREKNDHKNSSHESLYSGKGAQDILSIDALALFDRMGLREHLTRNVRTACARWSSASVSMPAPRLLRRRKTNSFPVAHEGRIGRKLRELDRSQNQAGRETFERAAKPVTPERMRP